MDSMEVVLNNLLNERSAIKSNIDKIKSDLIGILQRTNVYYCWDLDKELTKFKDESERLERVNEKINTLNSAKKVMEDEV